MTRLSRALPNFALAAHRHSGRLLLLLSLFRPSLPRLAAALTAGALGALLLTGTAHAQVLVNSTVTTNGSLYNYSYSVTNLTGFDVLVVNLNGLPQVEGAITNLTAPTGFKFQTPYDYNVGITSFLADSADFTPGDTIGGFSFTSAFAPSTVTFDTVGFGDPTTGTTLAPTAAPVPEASTLVSLGAGLLLLTAFTAVRRRRISLARS